MDKALAQAKEANKNFEASTFITRLKKAAEEQNGIANGLIASLANIIGMRDHEVDPADKRKIMEAAKQQVQTASDIRWIQEDLGHYHARTNEPVFKQVVDLMRESKFSLYEFKKTVDVTIDVGLEKIQDKLETNHAYTAIETSKNPLTNSMSGPHFWKARKMMAAVEVVAAEAVALTRRMRISNSCCAS